MGSGILAGLWLASVAVALWVGRGFRDTARLEGKVEAIREVCRQLGIPEDR